MTHYSNLNVQCLIHNLITQTKIKNITEVTLNLSSNVVGDPNDEYNFPHKLLLSYTQVSRRRKALANNSIAKIKPSKTQLYNTGQSILKTDLSLIKNALKLLAKSVLIQLGLIAPASATGAGIQKKVFGSGMTALTISNKEMDDMKKIIKSLESLLTESVSKAIKNEAEDQKDLFPGMLLGTLGTTLFGNI